MRAGRLVSLLMILQRHDRVTAASLAEQLEVSERTVLRDIDELSGAGVPVYAKRGRGGGFAIMEGYRVDLEGVTPRTTGRRRPGPRRRGAVLISPEGRRLAAILGALQPLRVRRAVPADAAGWLEATFRLDSHEAAVLELLSLSPHVRVLSPSRLREDLLRRLTEATAINEGVPTEAGPTRTS